MNYVGSDASDTDDQGLSRTYLYLASISALPHGCLGNRGSRKVSCGQEAAQNC